MSADTVTLSRADFDQIVDAFCTATDAIVALQELNKIGAEAMGSGLAFVLESVIARQEQAVCNASDMLHEKYGRDSFAGVLR